MLTRKHFMGQEQLQRSTSQVAMRAENVGPLLAELRHMTSMTITTRHQGDSVFFSTRGMGHIGAQVLTQLLLHQGVLLALRENLSKSKILVVRRLGNSCTVCSRVGHVNRVDVHDGNGHEMLQNRRSRLYIRPIWVGLEVD